MIKKINLKEQIPEFQFSGCTPLHWSESLIVAIEQIADKINEIINVLGARDIHKYESSKCACDHGKCRSPEPDCNKIKKDKTLEIFVCPKCNGLKTIESNCVPSPKIGGGYYRPDCPLCDAKGYIIHYGE